MRACLLPLLAFVFVSVSLLSSAAVAHRCIHDTDVRAVFHDKYPPVDVHLSLGDDSRQRTASVLGGGGGQTPHPLRFNVSAIDVFNTSRSCQAVNETVMDFKDGNITCTAADILTPEKRDALINVFLPDALERLSRYLSVLPFNAEGTLNSSSFTSDIAWPFTMPEAWCSNDTFTASIAGDFALLVAAGPTPAGNVAWAGSAAFASSMSGANSGRPVLGRLNVGPAHIPSAAESGTRVGDKFVRTLLHELHHALGYSYTHFATGFRLPNAVSVLGLSTMRGGAPNKILTAPTVAEAARIFYDCPTAELLLENEGGAGTADSHPERTVLFEDVMTGVEGTWNRVSNITLAVFGSMGYFFPNYSAAEPMVWGNRTGCSFLTEKCSSPQLSPRARDLFSFSSLPAKTTLGCTYDLHHTGRSVVANYTGAAFPPYWQYYGPQLAEQAGAVQLLDYCVAVDAFASTQCNYGNLSSGTGGEQLLGYSYGPGSRCVHAPALVDENYMTPTWDPNRCIAVRCRYNCSAAGAGSNYSGAESPHRHGVNTSQCTYQLLLRVRDAPTWQECPADGTSGVIAAMSPFKGDITCPEAAKICDPWGLAYGDDVPFESALPPPSTSTSTFTATSTTSTSTSTTTTTTATAAPSSTSDAATTATIGAGGNTTQAGTTAAGAGTTAAGPPPPSTTTTAVAAATTASAAAGATTSASTTTTTVALTLGTTASTLPRASTTAAAGGTVPTTTTADPNNNGGSGSLTGDVSPTACFLGALPCWVSYVLLALAGIVLGLILYWVYQKMCGGKSGSAADTANSNSKSQPRSQVGEVADAPLIDNRYTRMAQEMKTMTPAQVAATVSPASPPPPIMSPPPRFVSPSQMQLSPRALPADFAGVPMRPPPIYSQMHDSVYDDDL